MLAHGVMTFPSMIQKEPALWPARAFQAGETVLKVTGRWMSERDVPADSSALLLQFESQDTISCALALPMRS